MPKVRFATGQVVNFATTPSAADIEEVAQKLNIKPVSAPTPAVAPPVAEAPAPVVPTSSFSERHPILGTIGGLATGAAKGIGSSIAGASSLGEKILQAPLKAAGVQAQKPLGQQVKESGALAPEGLAQKIGFGAEQIGEFFIPGGAVGKGAKGLEAATGLAKGAEEVAGLAKAGKSLGRFAIRSGLEAGAVGGQTAIQQGEVGPEAGKAALFGAATPAVTGAIKGVGRVIGAEPERLIGKALGFTKSQTAKIDKIASEYGAYKGLKDFALHHGFGGSRAQIAQQIEQRFAELTAGTKPEVLAGIRELTPNTYKTAFEHLRGTYNVPGQEAALAEIEALAGKPELTGAELDKVRSLIDASLPQGAYKGAEPVKTEGLQNLVDPIRRRLEALDKTGTIRRINQDIRILHQMMKAAETARAGSVESVAAFRSALRSGAAVAAKTLGVPLPTVLAVPYVIYQGATDIPEVASYVASKLRGLTTKIPENIPTVLKKALERWK